MSVCIPQFISCRRKSRRERGKNRIKGHLLPSLKWAEEKMGGREGRLEVRETHHSVAGKFRIGLENAVRSRVIPSSVHGIRTGLVQRGWEADIFRLPPRDRDLCHCAVCDFYAPGFPVILLASIPLLPTSWDSN